MPYRTALHEYDRVVSILASDGRRKAENEAGFTAACHKLEAHGRQMVAFINDEVTIASDKIRHFTLADKALDQCNVYPTGGFPPASTDYPNGGGIN